VRKHAVEDDDVRACRDKQERYRRLGRQADAPAKDLGQERDREEQQLAALPLARETGFVREHDGDQADRDRNGPGTGR
jgi:hypothetical protein